MKSGTTTESYVEVILPLALQSTFTYKIPNSLLGEVELGKRVVVQFGASRYYTGIISERHHRLPSFSQIKSIVEVVDESPLVNQDQLSLWKWMADYYMCGIGEVMNAALPNAYKLVSDSVLLLLDGAIESNDLTDDEYLVWETLQLEGKQKLKQLKKLFPDLKLQKVVESLLSKGVVSLEEELSDKVKPKVVKYVHFPEGKMQDWCSFAASETVRAPKQRRFIDTVREMSDEEFLKYKVEKSEFLSNYQLSQGIYHELISKGIIVEVEEVTDRIQLGKRIRQEVPELSEAQGIALKSVQEGLLEKKPVLLHGITGSGKTELYFHLIHEAIDRGKQVLYLLPEIALTTQLVERVMAVFGDQVAVYHSRFNIQERAEIWKSLRDPSNKYKVVIGARSALFLPFNDLGLIIVDESHEGSFKQHDPSPRYHARDVAIYIAHQFKTSIVLGTATPSIESYYNAQQSRYHLVHLSQRYSGVAMPEIQCADLSEGYRKKKMQGVFSEFLVKEMAEVLEQNKQIILFQNRRGFSPVMSCHACGEVEKCSRCDVTYTYHKGINVLKCHYCGEQKEVELTCSHCGSADIGFKGFGTEKIEEQVKAIFPHKKVGRMDLETTRGKDAYQRIIQDFSDRKIDILVGTQMLTKGLDFDDVALVGVLNADQLLNHPDFRAFERAYQLLTQVSGRAGRRKKRGKVIIQTFSPYHEIIRQVMHQDYESLYKTELLHRKNFNYPPFYRLINITFKHTKKSVVDEAAQGYALAVRAELGEDRVLGPEYPSISMINRLYQKDLLIKFERSVSPKSLKQVLQKWKGKYLQEPGFKSLKINFDVDPL